MALFTIGHSTRTIDELIALLKGVGVEILVDIRTIARSRTNPQFNQDSLPAALADAYIVYRHAAALGGLRGRSHTHAPSANDLWRNRGFRNYADYAMTPAFRAGLDELEALARDRTCAIMCAEAVWWRCHRRIVADYLIADGIAVEHILGADKIEPARLTPGARVQPDRTIRYQAAAPTPRAATDSEE
jgi:uncharacterized protein (DUF488 family)